MEKSNHWDEKTSQIYEQFRAQGSSLITHIYPELQKLGKPYETISQDTIEKAMKIIHRYSNNDKLDDAWGVIIFRSSPLES